LKAAQQGSKAAIDFLESVPELPEEIEHLIQWVYELHGRSGATLGGIAPVSYSVIEAWMRLKDIGLLEPYEIEALVMLDATLLSDEEPDKADPIKLPGSTHQWPKRKGD
jgi:hypothetical protein